MHFAGLIEPAVLDKINSAIEASCLVPMVTSTAARIRDKTHLGQSEFSSRYWTIYSGWCGFYFIDLGQWYSFLMFIPQAALNAVSIILYYRHRSSARKAT